jgi:mannose-6-phosphate isomerase
MDKKSIIENYEKDPYPVKVNFAFKNYSWGEKGENTFIGKLFELSADQGPFAEAWLGNHPQGEALLEIEGQKVKLSELKIGSEIPWLFKFLSASETLSVQVHPDEKRAKYVYQAEIAKGLQGEDLTYKDDRAKPEMAIAVSDFYAMSGFQKKDELAVIFQNNEILNKYFSEDIELLKKAVLPDEVTVAKKSLFKKIMTMEQKKVNEILAELVGQIKDKNEEITFNKNQREYWLLKADELYDKDSYDVGIFAFFLLNFVHLTPFKKESINKEEFENVVHYQPGEALFMEAGIPHFYLEGVIVEVMACSDNVVRAGLTPKKKNINELLEIVRTEDRDIDVVKPVVNNEQADVEVINYQPAVKDFSVSLVIQENNSELSSHKSGNGTNFIIIESGYLYLRWGAKESKEYIAGDAIMLPPSDELYVLCGTARYWEIFKPE